MSELPSKREPIFNPQALAAWPVILLVASFVAIHLWTDYAGFREQMRVTQNYGFFSPALWQGQRAGTLLSHAFLHANWLHLGMNSAACLGLGIVCWRLMGTARFFICFILTAAAGAAAFALVRPEAGPLVGASGAIFGLLAVYKRAEFRELAARGVDVTRATLMFGVQMVLINAAFGFATGGIMAWEAHLGGMAMGWIIMPTLIRERDR